MKEEQTNNTTNVENEDTLTNRQGHPVTNNQNMRTVGNRGPATLENYDFIEKISHFDRERIPERVVHARGAGAHGYFEAYGAVGTRQFLNILVLNCFRKKERKLLFLFDFHPLFMEGILLKRCVIHVGLQ